MDPVKSIPGGDDGGDDGDASGSHAGAGQARLLFVCTANRIRSPFAAAVARRLAEEHRLPLVVSSGGLDEGGLPAVDQMVRVAREWGIDLDGHESRQVTTKLIESSDLTITMTGSHVIDLAGAHPHALTRLVTLREAAAVAQDEGPPEWNGPAVREWGARVAQRPLSVLLSGASDVEDPVGRPRRVHRRTAALIHGLVEQLLSPPTAPDPDAN